MLRDLLRDERVLVTPGVYDCVSARLAERAGFRALSSTGAGIVNARLGVPDVGLFSLRDNVDAVRFIARSVGAPLSADAETGYGNAASVHHVVREFEAAGAAAVSLEDQTIPKRCGHVQGKGVIPTAEMVGKVEAAAAARRSDDFLIVARTDAIATGGIEEACARARAYAEAGADVIFPDAVRGRDDVARLVEAAGVPVRINMGFGLRTRTTTPLLGLDELGALGVRWVSLSRLLPAAAIRGMERALAAMRESVESGQAVERPDLVADMSDIQALMDYETYFDIERRFVR